MDNKLRVLIIEDSEDDAYLMLHALKQSGYDLISERVETAENLISALDRVSWDIVISDYRMPRFSGGEALKLIKEKSLDLPFIIVSGKIGEETAVQMMRAGASDYVMKDNLERLVPAVKREIHEAQIRKERREAITKLKESEESYHSIFDAANDAILIHDKDSGNILDVNIKMTQMFRCSRDEALHLRIEDISADEPPFSRKEAMNKISAADEQPRQFEWRCRDRRGHLFWSEINLKSIKLAGKNRVLCVVRDISTRKLLEEELRAAAITDDLTGLLNRRGFFTFAEQQLKTANRSNSKLHLVYLDIDDFKAINDRISHKAGDQALVDAANILKKTFRESDIIARIGGDEFVVLLMEPLDMDINQLLFERMNGYIEEHNGQEGLQFKLVFSVGTALHHPERSTSIGDLLSRADQSMYKDKKYRKQQHHLSHIRKNKRQEYHPGDA